eukprot:GILK01012084.1.p1 GENE.GILK01012084.1~~GILK01012084.1.p1  ORF type:complete len:371 (+),score=66.88 GILK01012084.1:35-1114(+)
MQKRDLRTKQEDKYRELEVFGYHSRIFEDAFQAANIERMLIPCFGDEESLVDRYDVRLLLPDASALEFTTGSDSDNENEELNQERYNDIDAADRLEREEEPTESSHAAIPFSYEMSEEKKPEVETQQLPQYSIPFESPLSVPAGIKAPDWLREHQLMAYTARFVRSHGLPAEIVLKVKQSRNPLFAFLNDDDPLQPYYLFLKSISSSDMESLVSSLPPLKFPQSQQSQLSPPHAPSLTVTEPIATVVDPTTASVPAANVESVPVIDAKLIPPLDILVPPSEVSSAIDKLVDFVVRNGPEFEQIVMTREKNNRRFEFLLPWSPHNAYYKWKLAASRPSPTPPTPALEKTVLISKPSTVFS